MNDRQALQEVKKLFKDNLFERTAISKRGKLDTNRLSFYKTSPRIFAEKVNRSGKKYSIELLIDASGSMFDSRAIAAFTAAKNIVSVLQHVCPINVCMFNYLEKNVSGKEFMMWDYARFKESANERFYINNVNGKKYIMTKPDTVGQSAADRATGGNWEIINIHNGVDRLMQRPGGKILMILQDGSPSASGEKEQWHMTGRNMKNYPESQYKKMIQKFVKQGVDIVSFGIDTNSPRRYFDKFYRLGSPNEAFGAMVQYLKTVMSI